MAQQHQALEFSLSSLFHILKQSKCTFYQMLQGGHTASRWCSSPLYFICGCDLLWTAADVILELKLNYLSGTLRSEAVLESCSFATQSPSYRFNASLKSVYQWLMVMHSVQLHFRPSGFKLLTNTQKQFAFIICAGSQYLPYPISRG